MASARPSKFIHPGTAALASYRARKLATTQAIVQHAVQEMKHAPTPSDVRALAKVTQSSTSKIRTIIESAREKFVGSIQDYVDIHMIATKDALAAGNNEAAIKAAQWAMEKTSGDGASVIERDKAEGSSGTKILIGIRLGGQRDTVEGQVLDASPIEVGR
jgi:hypothetical protein